MQDVAEESFQNGAGDTLSATIDFYEIVHRRYLVKFIYIYELSEPITPAGFVKIKIIISYKVVSGIPVI